MHVVFFDVDRITADYLKNKQVCQCNITVFENSLEELTQQQYAAVKDAEVFSVFVNYTNVIGEKVLSRFPKLKLIAARSTGYDHIDLNYCAAHNIVVQNVPRYGEVTVAEYAMGLLLCLTRKIIRCAEDMKSSRYNIKDYIGYDLYGRTIGIIGTGAIGRHMIKLAKGFGMEVLAYDLYPNEEFARLYGIQYAGLQELYQKADFISLHAPATKDNHHMLNDEAFSKMKDGVVIINTARGELVDAEALFKNLLSGKVGGAALDVLEDEDLLIHDDIILKQQGISMSFAMNTIINNKLMHLPNVIITPHMAFNSVDAVHRILDATLKNVGYFVDKGEVLNPVKAR